MKSSRNVERSRRGRRNGDLQPYERVQQTVAQQAGADFISAIEAERGRIARELHDNAGQSLTGILLNIEVLERHLGSAGTEVLGRLARCRELACATLDQIRRISHHLNPPEWKEQDFPTALESLVESMGLRGRLVVDLGNIEVPGNLSPAIQTILYRTLQEGLTNVLRHARARRVRIEAPLTPLRVGLTLEDDGIGFDLSSLRSGRCGIGLNNIRQRVESLGGRFRVESAPGRGTRLSISVPIPGANDGRQVEDQYHPGG